MIPLFEFERNSVEKKPNENPNLDDSAISEKYENGEVRIVTEQGAFKLPFLSRTFSDANYKLQPPYQRRITWNVIKRSKLIESFIMNIPVPPVFLYEEDYNFYEVMDGLQRITSLIDFYDNKYALHGLQEWPELNGRKYSELPEKIKEGIDRRQLSYVTLLKESAQNPEMSRRMKKLVFERLNTGGVHLSDQEIRNALIGGPFNDLCIELSRNLIFCELWQIAAPSKDESLSTDKSNSLFARMDDVELVLRYFAMRNIDDFRTSLSGFLDQILLRYNSFSHNSNYSKLEETFIKVLERAKQIFGQRAFCLYKLNERKQVWVWSKPQKFIYDAMMIALSSDFDFSKISSSQRKCIKALEHMYQTFSDDFNGKKTGRTDIQIRVEHFEKLLHQLLED